MDELIKIAGNGQWTLEKAAKTKEEMMRQVEEFMARKKTNPSRPAATTTTMPANMRPASTSSGTNPNMSKEQVAAQRAAIDKLQASGLNISQKDLAEMTPKASPEEQHKGKVQAKLSNEQAKADEAAKRTSGRKEAWEAGVAFLAQHGNKGYQALKAQMDQRKVLDQAHKTGSLPKEPKPELLPPQEYVTDPVTKERKAQPRQGTFHNQGATTTGKLVSKPHSYEDKATGERRFTRHVQQEQHHWSWDHNNKKWNHVRTAHVSPSGTGGASQNPTTETSRPKAGTKEALFPKKDD